MRLLLVLYTLHTGISLPPFTAPNAKKDENSAKIFVPFFPKMSPFSFSSLSLVCRSVSDVYSFTMVEGSNEKIEFGAIEEV